jgi:CheY-like chemotaxis protein
MREVSPNSILLVDDDPSVRKLLSMHLVLAGFVTRQAQDGIEGLVKLRDELPKVIICDLEMPRMAGLEFSEVVRRRFPSIPVIAFSGAIPGELPAESGPSRWFEKNMQQFPDLVVAVNELAQRTPDQVCAPEVIGIPVRTRREFPDHLVLTCTDCLRKFRATSTPENDELEGTAVCTH